MTLTEEINKLSAKKRNRRNLEQIQAFLEQLQEHADNAEEAVNALARARETAEELRDALDDDENPLLPWSVDTRELADEFAGKLPEEGESVADLIREATDYAEEYENSLDERMDADDRQEMWDNLINALDNISSALG